MPNSFETNGFVLNGSKSSICSPVPMKMIGLFVAATLQESFSRDSEAYVQIEWKKNYTYALRAPPPFA
jgi:hypothetical protein